MSDFKWDSLVSLSVEYFKKKTLTSILEMAPNLRDLILERGRLGRDQNLLIRSKHLKLLDISEIKDVAEIKVQKEKTSEELIMIRGSKMMKVLIFEIE